MTLYLSGQKFGKLIVGTQVRSEVRSGRSRRFWYCVCECGKSCWIEPSNLTTGNSSSCGHCVKIKHGHATRLGSQTPTYKSWAAMLSRCRDKNVEGYYLYGGRGIKVCRRWLRFENFLADMGERPAHKTIERRNTNGNYTPKNCYWATTKEQGQNRRTTRMSFSKADRVRQFYRGGLSKAEIARKFDVSFSTISKIVDGSRWNRVGVGA